MLLGVHFLKQMNSLIKEECEKEKMTLDEVISLLLKIIIIIIKIKKISLDKHFCFRFGTIVIIFLFIDVERYDR